MSVQNSTDLNTRPFVLAGFPVALRKDDQKIKQDAGRTTVLASKTLMARLAISSTVAVAADAGNTGDGTVTSVSIIKGNIPKVGAHVLEFTAAGEDGRAAGSVTADAGNTGDGTVTSLAIVSGEFPKVGNWILKCTDPNAGGGKSAAAVFAGTGNGGISAITTGLETIEGDYVATCIDATVSGSEIFEVIDPNGNKLEDATVAVAYSNAHLGFTIADGGTDYIVGDKYTITATIAHGGKFTLTDPDGVDVKEDITLPGTTGGNVAVNSGGISFTITDGATDFAEDDFFTLVVAAADGGEFKLSDPDGNVIAGGLTMSGVSGGATVFYEGGFKFTVTDGATDFAIGDKFTLTVAADGDWTPYDPASVLADKPQGIFDPEGSFGSIAAASIVAGDVSDCPILIVGARFDKNQLVIENSGALTDIVAGTGLTVEEYLRQRGLIAENTIAASAAENA